MEADPPAYYILQSQGNVYPCVETPQGKTKVFAEPLSRIAYAYCTPCLSSVLEFLNNLWELGYG